MQCLALAASERCTLSAIRAPAALLARGLLWVRCVHGPHLLAFAERKDLAVLNATMCQVKNT